MSSSAVSPPKGGPVQTRDERLAQQKARTQTLRAIDLGTVLNDRYGAVKDGRETIAMVKKTQERCRQQKWKLGQGHHINVLENGSFWDLSFRQGGAGAIDLVMHLERCNFETAANYLETWYPNAATFAGTLAPRANRQVAEAPPSKPKVLPAVRFSSPRFRENKERKWEREDRSTWERTRTDYNTRVRDYLVKERSLHRDVVEMALANNWAYPVEKTTVFLLKSPAAEQFADELEALAVKNNWQFTQSAEDNAGHGHTVLHRNLRKEAIKLRMETRPEFDRLLQSPPAYKLAGSADEFRPEIATIHRQPELAFPILKFLSHEPIATSLRSLTGSHKQALGPKTEGAFVINPLSEFTKRLILTESPNEAMSCLTLKYREHLKGKYPALKPEVSGNASELAEFLKSQQDVTYFGLSGSGNINELIPFLKQRQITVENAFNNEGAGRKFARRIHEQLGGAGIHVEDNLPPGGEVDIEAVNDEENKKFFNRLRETAVKHRLRFVDKTVPATPGGAPEKYRMRIESSEAVWEQLDVNDPSARRKYLDAQKAGTPTEGYWHFRETAVIEAVGKDYNDVLKEGVTGETNRIFTTAYARDFDSRHDYMSAKGTQPVEGASVDSPASRPAASVTVAHPITEVDGPELD